MGVRLLGPVEVQAGGRRLDLGPPQQRAMLAALAVDAGLVVRLETLVDRVWGAAPPVGVRPATHALIAKIRRVLDQVNAAGDGPAQIVRRTGGYLLDADPDWVDLHRFRRLVATARDRHRPGPERARLLRDALGLWHGAPLADLHGDWPDRMREGWRQQRLDAAVAWAEAELAVGQHVLVIGTIRDLVADYPLAEPLVGVLMRALVAAGRLAEAVDSYATARARFAAELGTEPSPALSALHEAILRGELPTAAAAPGHSEVRAHSVDGVAAVDVDPAPGPAPGGPAGRPVPAQLPAGVPDFAGRRGELAELDRLLAAGLGPAGAEPNAVVISAVAGTAGVGKTALALRWAHQVRDQFPDGQLYLNLRGYHPDQPMAAGDALARLLGALGLPAGEVPLDLEERAARYRTELAGRRMLIVLDNAGSADQVRPLLPGTASSVVLVTSRDSLAGLVARHGARRLDLDLLPPDDARALLRMLIGPRADAEPAAVECLAALCARLPLALRVAAELAGSLPGTRLSELARELADQSRRLALLDAGGDDKTAVRTVLSWSYRHLPHDARRLFRLLGLHPGPDVDRYAAAALAGTSLADSSRLLESLARVHLVQRTGPGRYGLHDLLRAYAADLADAHDPAAARAAALTRLFDHYLATAAAAVNTLFPASRARRPSIDPPAPPAPAVGDVAAARAWLAAERANLLAVAAHAAARDWAGHAVLLARSLGAYLDSGHFTEALVVHDHGLRAARRSGDRSAEAHMLKGLGSAYRRRGDSRRAIEHHRRSLALFRELGDRDGEIPAEGNLGMMLDEQGRYAEAGRHFERVLELINERAPDRAGDRDLTGRALDALGRVRRGLGRYEEAADLHRRALEIFQEDHNAVGQARALGNLGLTDERLGHHAEAAARFQAALDLFRTVGHLAGEGNALDGLGMAYQRQGRYPEAVGYLRQAVALSRRIGARSVEASALLHLGEVHWRQDRLTQAADYHRRSAALFREIGKDGDEAAALTQLGRIRCDQGRPAAAVEPYRRAQALYAELGATLGENEAGMGLAAALAAAGQPEPGQHG
jgi:tetratricopeptide (TPR) repeat protein